MKAPRKACAVPSGNGAPASRPARMKRQAGGGQGQTGPSNDASEPAPFRLPDDLPPYFLRGKGYVSEAQAREGARAAIAARAAIRALEDAGGAIWAAGLLRDELARIEAGLRKPAHRLKGTKAGSSDAMLMAALIKRKLSAPRLAELFHQSQPGKFGASKDAITKTIIRLRADAARRGEGVVMVEAIKRNAGRSAEAVGLPPAIFFHPKVLAVLVAAVFEGARQAFALEDPETRSSEG